MRDVTHNQLYSEKVRRYIGLTFDGNVKISYEYLLIFHIILWALYILDPIWCRSLRTRVWGVCVHVCVSGNVFVSSFRYVLCSLVLVHFTIFFFVLYSGFVCIKISKSIKKLNVSKIHCLQRIILLQFFKLVRYVLAISLRVGLVNFSCIFCRTHFSHCVSSVCVSVCAKNSSVKSCFL